MSAPTCKPTRHEPRAGYERGKSSPEYSFGSTRTNQFPELWSTAASTPYGRSDADWVNSPPARSIGRGRQATETPVSPSTSFDSWPGSPWSAIRAENVRRKVVLRDTGRGGEFVQIQPVRVVPVDVIPAARDGWYHPEDPSRCTGHSRALPPSRDAPRKSAQDGSGTPPGGGR